MKIFPGVELRCRSLGKVPAARCGAFPATRRETGAAPKWFAHLALDLAACTATTPSVPQAVTRVVLIWLKNPSSATDRAQIIRTAQALRMMPGVAKVTTGRAAVPAAATDRSFDLGVIITFRDRAAYLRYERDPHHAQAIERFLRPLVQRYEVYNQGVR